MVWCWGLYLPGCNAVSMSVRFPVYQRIMVPSSSRDRTAWTWTGGTTTIQMSWTTHPVAWHHIPYNLNPQYDHIRTSDLTSSIFKNPRVLLMNMCMAHMTQDFSFYYSHTRIISKIWRHSWQKTGLLQEVMEQHRQLRLFWYTFTVTLIFSEEVQWNCTTRVNETWQNLVMNDRCCEVSTHQLWWLNRW